MRGPAGNDAAECTCCEVVARVQLDLLLGLQGTKLVGHCASVRFQLLVIVLFVDDVGDSGAPQAVRINNEELTEIGYQTCGNVTGRSLCSRAGYIAPAHNDGAVVVAAVT